MKICRVQIDNYRNLKHVDVELGDIVTLIGENNSGKSNLLRAISLPLSADDSGLNKRLLWSDINKETKNRYYEFLKNQRDAIVEGVLSLDEFTLYIPTVKVVLNIMADEKEHYDIKDILVDEDAWIGGIEYRFYVKRSEELFARVRSILMAEPDENNIKMSLLPMELYEYSIVVPGRDSKIPFDTLSMFRSVDLPAERDNFASNADRLGSKALSDLLQKGLTADSEVKIEKAYFDFFETVRTEGKLDEILNWQEYSDIYNAQDFFQQISILPNMPQMSSIISSIRLGYEEENMFMQGLGHRNLILMTVLLNSYISKQRNISYRLMTIEEPEAHLSLSNILLMISIIRAFGQKNSYTQIVYSTHNAEFVNKIGLDKVLVFHRGEVISLRQELSSSERDYISANPNTDIFALLYSRKTILVEGITEELLIKSYLQTRQDLNDIKVLSFHKGFTRIIEVWKKVNAGSGNKIGVVRDFDDQPRAQEKHEALQDENIIVQTTNGYTLETDITSANFNLLKENYGLEYGWSEMSPEELQEDWRKKKSEVMLRICHDLVHGTLHDFRMPSHIQKIIDFLQEGNNAH